METKTETLATIADDFGVSLTTARHRMEGFTADHIGNGSPLSAADASLVRSLVGRDKPRCQFGRPHVWMLGFYQEGQWIEGHVKCGTCGQIEEER